MTKITRVRQVLNPNGQGRHLALLISLLFLFVVSPFVLPLRYGVILMDIAGVIVLLLGLHAISARKGSFIVATVLAFCTVAASWLMVVLQREPILIASYGLVLVLLGLFSFSILGYVLRADKISADKIYGAVCVYLLVGYAWTFGYATMELIQPGSFSGLAEKETISYAERVMELRYFSLATLTTVGYGDIAPRSSVARTMATLEAIMGQFYLAVLVARLVGLHIVHASASRSDDPK